MNTRFTARARALQLLLMFAFAAAPANAEEGVLKGKVQKLDAPTRIQRPTLPPLVGAATDDSDFTLEKKKDPLKATVIKEDDFITNFMKQTPKLAKEDPALSAEAEDGELIIEWERWHKRFSQAVFERWRELGRIPGFARTTITITRDRRLTIDIGEVELPPDVYEVMKYPQFRVYSLDRLKQMYADAIRYAVTPLDGSSVLEFPQKSRRKVVVLTPFFSGNEEEGYHWVHGDKERVPLHQ